jgi:tetratricopeptide (TPR) repeat protein
MTDVFQLQDRITERVAATIEPTLQSAEIERLKNKPASNLSAYESLLRAQQLEYQFSREAMDEALSCLKQALSLDPDYAQAMALAAYCYAWRRPQGWFVDTLSEASEGARLACRAVELAKDDANVLWMAGYAIWQLAMDARQAKDLTLRSLAINPNSAIALTTAGYIEVNSGNVSAALEYALRAERLNPRDPRGWANLTVLAFAKFLEDRWEEALSLARRGLLLNPRYNVLLRIVAASLAKLGRKAEAENVIKQILATEPELTLSKQRARSMFIAQQDQCSSHKMSGTNMQMACGLLDYPTNC